MKKILLILLLIGSIVLTGCEFNNMEEYDENCLVIKAIDYCNSINGSFDFNKKNHLLGGGNNPNHFHCLNTEIKTRLVENIDEDVYYQLLDNEVEDCRLEIC